MMQNSHTNANFRRPVRSEKKRITRTLFVCGCPRSGTSAFWNLLHLHKNIILGNERFNRLVGTEKLNQSLFEFNRFFTFEAGDTFYTRDSSPAYERMYEFMETKQSECEVIGDKTPQFYEDYDVIFERFADPYVIFLARNLIDVANSYQQRSLRNDPTWSRDRDWQLALRQWNSSMSATVKLLDSENRGKLLIVPYEDFYSSPKYVERILRFIGLDSDDSFAASSSSVFTESEELNKDRRYALTSHMMRALINNADIPSYKKLIKSDRSIIVD
jgi:hypothetical protein